MAAPKLWPLRDDRTLSAYAKLAYFTLWTRLPDIHPSMATLAADMSVSKTTAKNAVRELAEAGFVKVIPRVTGKRENDSNIYELTEVGHSAPHPASPSDLPVGHPATPKNGTTSTEGKGDKSRASRLARPAVTRTDEQKIAVVRQAVDDRGWDNRDLEDDEALDIYARFITERVTDDPLGDEVKYLYSRKTGRGIFASFDHLDGVLSNTPEREGDWLNEPAA